MPTPSTAKWPKPRSEDEFEDLCVDFLKRRWQDPQVARNGRRGQRQNGVDIIGHPPWLNRKAAGAQCKNTEKLTLASIVAEVTAATGFSGGLGEYLVVTSADRDGRLRSNVSRHYKTKPPPFMVDVVFWEDIVAEVSKDEQLVAHWWRGFGSRPAPCDAEIVASMAQLFDRPAFTTPFHGESNIPAFKQALTDTIMSLNTGVRRTREGVALPSIHTRHDVKDPHLRQSLAEVERELIALRGAFDDLVKRGEIRLCSCDVPNCGVFEASRLAIEEMDRRRRAVLERFRDAHPAFVVRVGW